MLDFLYRCFRDLIFMYMHPDDIGFIVYNNPEKSRGSISAERWLLRQRMNKTDIYMKSSLSELEYAFQHRKEFL